MSEAALDPRIAQQAAEWFLLLQSGEASADDRAAFEHWRRGDPQCERAWQRAEHVGATLGNIPASVGMPALRRRRRSDRRDALKTLALLVAAPSAAWLGYRQLPWQSWRADYRTDIGERRDFALPDASHVWLNTDSAIDVDYGERERLLHLRSGEILVQTAPDRAAVSRPFVVATRDGRIRALGTRFIVRRHDDATTVTVLERAVEIRPGGAGMSRIIEAGTSTRFDALAIGPAVPAAVQADAWTQGVIYADGMRLDDFIAELGRYRPGVVRCHPDVAALKVSGAFQVRDTEPVLRSLTRALPVSLVYRTRWWVSVEPG
ncbi:MAG TPA: FecR domain-containing protein [Povalibacter sp.]|uniref:FecR domain-containing protein n=1 Tax=Povalibacter sp. TaxID=1962978 RepID=UPI002C364055|nr:FecR domain-containing protein [Povalibacter sp.]HMN43783.1 FecR domain-containing protein [Povalibacter sp.]